MKIKIALLTVSIFYLTTPTRAEPSTNNKNSQLSKAREIGTLGSKLKFVPNITKNSTVIPKANLTGFNKYINPILKKSCIDCHGPKKVKGKFRIDTLNPDLLKGPHINKWLEVYEVLTNSEMPPEDELSYHISESERNNIIDWLGEEMKKASQVRRNDKGHSSFRRMTKYEYNYALQDILGLPYNFSDALPNENISEDGFKNSSELLQMSAMQFEAYRELGLRALKKATVIGERPGEVVFVISPKIEMEKIVQKSKDAKNSKGKKSKGPRIFEITDKDPKSQRSMHLISLKQKKGTHWNGGKFTPVNKKSGENPPLSDYGLILNRNEDLKLNLSNKIPDEGILRVRIRAGHTKQKKDEYTSIRLSLSAQTSNNASFKSVISSEDKLVTAPASKPEFIEFFVPLSEIPRNPLRHTKGNGRTIEEYFHIQNISNSQAKLYIDHIELTGPYYKTWPPQSHKAIFSHSQNKRNEVKYCQEILKKFMIKAWRRPIKTNEIKGYVDLFTKYRPQFASFEETMLEVLATVLASPDFLYITERIKEDKLSSMELAMRLSIFLWSSIPDNELLRLAYKGKLRDSKVLLAQTKRMLADSRAKRFSKNYVEQWLGLHKIDGVNVDKKRFKIYNDDFKAAILKEPISFFSEILKNNSSIIDFIHSDYVMINEQLADHYKINDIKGPHFRKVIVPESLNRGGILTSAAVLTMNSDGKFSHPLKRGIWLLEHILNDPPPPPPANVPEVDLTDPEVLKMTLKERIVDHRNKVGCRSCHAKIDPWGIAFENYDALGKFRTAIDKKPVDATSELFNKQKLNGMIGLKKYLLEERQDQFSRAFVHKMVSYALGRPLTFSDRSEVDRITSILRRRGDKLGDLVDLIVTSKIFHSK